MSNCLVTTLGRRRSGRPVRSAIAALIAVVGAATHPASARAQDGKTMTPEGAAIVKAQYLDDLDTLHAKIVALAKAIPEDKYSWRPSAGVRSVSEVLMHIASEWYYYVPRSVAANPPADFGAPKEKLPALEKITKKSDVLSELDKSWTWGRAQLAGADASKLTGRYKPWDMYLPGAALSMAGDLHEHLGQLIAYARSNGVTPPWSK